jgi:hypothetical protein
MINARAISRELQDQVLNRFRKGQETVTATVRTWAHAAQAVKPQLTSLPVPTVRLHDVTDRLPGPKALATSTQALAHQMMAAQHKLAEQAVRSAAPLLPRRVPATRRPGTAESAPAATRPGSAAVAKPESAAVAKPEPWAVATAEPATVAKPEPGKEHTRQGESTAAASAAAARSSTTADAGASTDGATTADDGTPSARSAATRAGSQKTAAKRPSAAKKSSGAKTRAPKSDSATMDSTTKSAAKNPRTPRSGEK